jgi:hypothetical protein
MISAIRYQSAPLQIDLTLCTFLFAPKLLERTVTFKLDLGIAAKPALLGSSTSYQWQGFFRLQNTRTMLKLS